MSEIRKVLAHHIIIEGEDGKCSHFDMSVARMIICDNIISEVEILPFHNECAGVEFYNGTVKFTKGEPFNLSHRD